MPTMALTVMSPARIGAPSTAPKVKLLHVDQRPIGNHDQVLVVEVTGPADLPAIVDSHLSDLCVLD